jgi:hypothetical protein
MILHGINIEASFHTQAIGVPSRNQMAFLFDLRTAPGTPAESHVQCGDVVPTAHFPILGILHE